MVNRRYRVNSLAIFVDNSIEPIVVVSGVVHSAHCAVGFHQTVRSLHHVTISGLPLALLVTCVWIVNSVVESVARVSLSENGVGFNVMCIGPCIVVITEE